MAEKLSDRVIEFADMRPVAATQIDLSGLAAEIRRLEATIDALAAALRTANAVRTAVVGAVNHASFHGGYYLVDAKAWEAVYDAMNRSQAALEPVKAWLEPTDTKSADDESTPSTAHGD